jgi:hypothetical protein
MNSKLHVICFILIPDYLNLLFNTDNYLDHNWKQLKPNSTFKPVEFLKIMPKRFFLRKFYSIFFLQSIHFHSKKAQRIK